MSAPDSRLQTTEGESAQQRRATIAILDYGSQYTQLIARRVRESRVYCEIFPHDVTAKELERRSVVGVILSGGPSSVYDTDAPLIEPAVLDGRFPVLGICYGMHLMAHVLGLLLYALTITFASDSPSAAARWPPKRFRCCEHAASAP